MENTKQTPPIEDKTRFFAQYYGQNILKINSGMGIRRCIPYWWEKTSDSYLELKPFSKITDEEAMEIIRIEKFVGEFEEIIVDDSFLELLVNIKKGICNRFSVVDFLRSKGYAVPFMEHSVEDLVSFGWVKLLNE